MRCCLAPPLGGRDVICGEASLSPRHYSTQDSLFASIDQLGTLAMPPKKATSSPPLAGYTIATSGTFSGTNQAGVQAIISSLGANVAKSVTADTNIVVSTEADVKKRSKKVQDAQSSDIPIVSLDWLHTCASSLKPIDTEEFLLVDIAVTAPPPIANSNCKGTKRAASPDLASPPAQKAVKVVPLASAPKLEPKVGEESVLKSRNVNIPLDEGCPLQTYRVYVDDAGIVYDASLNQTNASHNNNKFYRVQVRCSCAIGRTCTDLNSFSGILQHATTRRGPAGAG